MQVPLGDLRRSRGCQALMARGEVAEGVALLDEAMVAVPAERSLARRLTGCRLPAVAGPCSLHIIATMAASHLHSRRLG